MVSSDRGRRTGFGAEGAGVTRPLRILHVIADLHSGGVQHLLAKSLAQMDRTSLRHHVCCITMGGVYQTEIEALGVPVSIMVRRHRFAPDMIGQIAHLMRTQQIDVVHTLNFTANAWGRVAAVVARVPRIIAHERGTAWTDNRVMRLANRLLYPFTTLMLANSQAAKLILCQHVGLPADRIQVIYNGLPVPQTMKSNVNLRQILKIAENAPLVGFIGRLDTPKGLFFLLQALPFIWQEVPEAHIAIIGTGPLDGALCQTAEQLGLQETNRLHFMGYVPDAATTLSQMDVLLHPAFREPFGNVLVEAGFAAVPVVACNVDGAAEVVVNKETGLLVDCTEPVTFVPVAGASPLPEVVVDGHTRTLRPPLGPNPQILATHTIALLRDPALRRRLGEKAKERAMKLFTLERYVRELEAVYRDDDL
jgi:glycosyltransferase involved in cell wall biosynthesis